MEKQKTFQVLVCIALCCMLTATVVFAAPEGGGRRDPRQGGQQGRQGRQGRGGGFDRAAMQERMLGMMKERIGATDEEWTIIQPRLSEVMTLSQGGARGMMRMFGRGRRGRGDRPQEQNAQTSTDPVEKAADELQQTLDKEAPSTAEIKAKLQALRGAKEKNKQKLAAAQQKLREVLTLKQEAMLVMMGMLE